MDLTRMLGAMLHERTSRSSVNQRAMHEAMRRRMQRSKEKAYQHTHGDVFHGHTGEIINEGFRRHGQPLPGWPAGGGAPFSGAPGHGHGHGHWEPPCSDYQDRAKLLLQAMIQAAKADGRIDPSEQQAITGRMGRLSPDEVAFLRHEFARPIDVHGLARATPQGMEADVYAASLMAIHLDNRYEGRYLHELADCLRLPHQVVDRIHHQMGEPCPR